VVSAANPLRGVEENHVKYQLLQRKCVASEICVVVTTKTRRIMNF
jgi:hypothetical protein